MSNGVRAEMPNFLMLTTIARGKEKFDYIEVKSRINPYHITSYTEWFLENYKGEEVKKITVLNVLSTPYYVDMTIEEIDEMINEIDRGLSFKEDI